MVPVPYPWGSPPAMSTGGSVYTACGLGALVSGFQKWVSLPSSLGLPLRALLPTEGPSRVPGLTCDPSAPKGVHCDHANPAHHCVPARGSRGPRWPLPCLWVHHMDPLVAPHTSGTLSSLGGFPHPPMPPSSTRGGSHNRPHFLDGEAEARKTQVTLLSRGGARTPGGLTPEPGATWPSSVNIFLNR